MIKRLLVILAIFLSSCTQEQDIIQGEVDATVIQVSAKIPSRIEDIFVHRGSKVEAKALVAQLSSPELQAKLEQAKATKELAKAQEHKAFAGLRPEEISQSYNQYKAAQSKAQIAQKTYQRIDKLFNDGVVSLQKKDEAKAAFDAASSGAKMAKKAYEMAMIGARKEDKQSAKASVLKASAGVKEVEAYLEETQVKSPISGEVSNIIAQKGEVIPAGFPIISVVNLDDIWVVFSIREDKMPSFTMGKTFLARFPALNNKTFELKTSFISPLGSYATYKTTNAKGGFDLKSFEIHARPTKKIAHLRPGMSAIIVND